MKLTSQHYAEAILSACQCKKKEEITVIVDNSLRQAKARGRRIRFAKAVLEQVEATLRERAGIDVVEVTTVHTLSDKETESLKKDIRTRFGPKTEIGFKQDKSLIGGATLIINNDLLIDASLANSVRDLRSALLIGRRD